MMTDTQYSDYVEAWADKNSTLRSYRVCIAALLAGLSKPNRVLDFGCGTGHSTLMLASGIRNVVGLEPNNELLQKARVRCKDNPAVKFVSYLYEIDGTFDAILLHHVLPHITSVDVTLSYLVEHLRHGGSMVVGVPNFNYGKKWFRSHKGDPTIVNKFSLSEWDHIFYEVGDRMGRRAFLTFSSTYGPEKFNFRTWRYESPYIVFKVMFK